MYFRVELTHRCGVPLPEGKRRREDWLFGRIGLGNVMADECRVRALELHPPRVNHNAAYAWLYKPEFVAITGRSITFSGLERTSIGGETAWVQQSWACVFTDDVGFMRWVRSLERIPEWAVLLG